MIVVSNHLTENDLEYRRMLRVNADQPLPPRINGIAGDDKYPGKNGIVLHKMHVSNPARSLSYPETRPVAVGEDAA